MKVCHLCKKPIESSDRVYFEVTGFERPRTQGGTNALRLREQTGRVAHVECVDKAAQGVEPGQASLL
jgi:hypothetical protein